MKEITRYTDLEIVTLEIKEDFSVIRLNERGLKLPHNFTELSQGDKIHIITIKTLQLIAELQRGTDNIIVIYRDKTFKKYAQYLKVYNIKHNKNKKYATLFYGNHKIIRFYL